MEVLPFVILILASVRPTVAYNPEVLDYVLGTLKYLASVQPGIFSCVFYDAAPEHPFDDSILEAILKSPQLDRHITKYVANVSYHQGLGKPPQDPSVLLISFGSSFDHIVEITNFLVMLDPKTKVLVFVNHSHDVLLRVALLIISKVRFTYSVFMDSLTMAVTFCNGINCGTSSRLPQPIYLFEAGRRNMAGRKIIYIVHMKAFGWNAFWLIETVRYLHTQSVYLEHDCKGSGDLFHECLKKIPGNGGNFDINFDAVYAPLNFAKDYKYFATNVPLFSKIAVPRDRPLGVAELMLMPLSWQVWILLIMVIVCTEMIRYIYPQHFRNDPFLLAVCGFERHNLHLAGRWEKTIFFSLIVLMFLICNVYETKIVALMTCKPSIQKVKSLTDLLNSNIRFHEDLNNNPHVKDLHMGKLYIQGEYLNVTDTIPGVGVIAGSEIIELLEETAFDYKRKLPFYVVLDEAYSEGPETYMTGYRSLFLQPFRTMHGMLVESGLFIHWKRVYKHLVRSEHINRKPRESILDNHYLTFDDMQPAWMVLIIGMSVSLIGFLGELLNNMISSKLSFRLIQKNYLKCIKKYLKNSNTEQRNTGGG